MNYELNRIISTGKPIQRVFYSALIQELAL